MTLDIVLDEKEKGEFAAALRTGDFYMDDWVSKIDLATAQAQHVIDEQNILAQVNAFGGGVQRLNEIVIDIQFFE